MPVCASGIFLLGANCNRLGQLVIGFIPCLRKQKKPTNALKLLQIYLPLNRGLQAYCINTFWVCTSPFWVCTCSKYKPWG